MSEHIAVGITDSPGSQRALDWAVDRASGTAGELLLVAVVGDATGVTGEDSLLLDAEAKTLTLLEAAASRARTRGIPSTVILERGDPVHRLVEVSRQVDLLVIGSDFAGTRKPSFRGPRGIRIAAASVCPVVVIPDLSLDGRAGVVVGVDGSATSEKAIAFAAKEADRIGAPLTAVSVWSPVPLPFELDDYPEDYLARMQTLAEETLSIALAGLTQEYPSLVVRTEVRSGFPAAAVAHAGQKARLIVVGSHGRGAVARFLLGSTSQELLDRLPAPTAVVR